jgi:FkbM family methyltransferase
VLVDGGANAGQFAQWVRRLGYDGRIVSFEPTSAAFRDLANHAEGDPAWDCRRAALGARDQAVEIGVAGSSTGSSVFAPAPLHLKADPEGRRVTTETVPMVSLESIWPEIVRPGDRVYLKLDVEGSELAALMGAGAVLTDISYVETELSLAPMYVGSPLFSSVLAHLESSGFSLFSVEPGSAVDPETGQMLLVDAIFHRDETHPGQTQDIASENVLTRRGHESLANGRRVDPSPDRPPRQPQAR